MEGLQELDGILRYGMAHVLRVTAAVAMVPIFQGGPASRLMRLVLGVVLGVTVAVARSDHAWDDPGGGAGVLVRLVLQEIFLGLLLGWLAGLVLDVMTVAGSLIATEMGVHMANQVDPNTHTQVPVTGFLFRNMGVILFFASGGHRIVLAAFTHSFDANPPGSLPPPDAMIDTVLGFTGMVLAAGLKIAAPVFFILVVVTVCIGFLAKMAPNLHILEASFPIRILSGLLLMVLMMPVIMEAFEDVLEQAGQGLFSAVSGGR